MGRSPLAGAAAWARLPAVEPGGVAAALSVPAHLEGWATLIVAGTLARRVRASSDRLL